MAAVCQKEVRLLTIATGMLSQNVSNHVAVYVGQTIIAALNAERQACMVKSEHVQQRGVQVVDVYRMVGNVES